MSTNIIDGAVDAYCHEFVRIEPLGPNRRLIFTVPSVDSPGFVVVQVKLIVPAEYSHCWRA